MDIGAGAENVLNAMRNGIRLKSGLIQDRPDMQRDRGNDMGHRNKDPTWMG